MENENEKEIIENTEETPAKNNNTFLIFGIVLALVVVGVVLFAKSAQKNEMVAGDSTQVVTMEENPAAVSDQDTSAPESETWLAGENPEGMDTADPQEEIPAGAPITVEGGMFYYEPNVIRVKKDQAVKIVFNNKEGVHDFVIDELEVKTKTIQAGQSETVEFIATEAGTFEFYCSVGNHRQMGMKGTLIVE